MKINKLLIISIFSFITFSNLSSFILSDDELIKTSSKEEYKIEISSSSSYSYSVNEDINFDVSSIYEFDDSYSFNWSIYRNNNLIFENNNKSFVYRFNDEGIYDINLSINNNINLSRQINVYQEKNHDISLSFNCSSSIAYLLKSSLDFEIEAYIDEVKNEDYIYNWVIEDHNIITFSSLNNDSSIILKPISEGKTKLILNASKEGNDLIKSNSIDIIVIKEIKSIDALPSSNYMKPGSDLIIDFTINTIPHVVNYLFNYEIYFNNELFLDYTKILNYSVLITNLKEGKYTVKIESISSFKNVNITCDKYQFRAIFMMILPYIISILLIVLLIFIYVKTKKKKALTIKECLDLLITLKEKYYKSLEENKMDEKNIHLTYKKLFSLIKALKIEADRFVMYISADAYNIVSNCEDTLSFLHRIKIKDFKKLSLLDKEVIIDMIFKQQVDEILNKGDLFLKNYNEYQSYRDEENKKAIKEDKLPTLKLEFKSRNDYLSYLLELAKKQKEKEDAIDK